MNKLYFFKTYLAIAGLLFYCTVKASVINVPADQSTIQQAIDASVNSDTILVDIGTYKENVRFNGKNITLASKYILNYDSSYIEKTIIDGSNGIIGDTASCVAFLNGEDTTAILRGFTLINGNATKVINNGNTLYEGGGIIIFNASPTIANNIIKNNHAVGGGGGIASFNTSLPRIYNNIIAKNTGGYAGGIVLNWCGGFVKNNIIFNNLATGNYGTGGLMVWDNGSNVAYIENNTIIGNHAYTTAGGFSSNRTGTSIVKNNLIKNNTQGQGDENVIVSGTTYENNNSSLEVGNNGNINVLPVFIGGQFAFTNAEAGTDIGANKGSHATKFPDFRFESIKTNNALIFNMAQGVKKTVQLLITNNSAQEIVIDSITYPDVVTGMETVAEFSGDTIAALMTDTINFTIQTDDLVNIFDSVLIYHQFTSIENPVSVSFILDTDKKLKEDISDLQAHFTFNDITDNKITDELGVTNGSCTNAMMSAVGVDGMCLGINAKSTASVTIPNSDSVNFGKGESFSISLLYKGDPISNTDEVFLLMKGATSGNWYAISTKSGQLRFTVDDDIIKTTINYSIPEDFDVRLWHNIVVVRDCDKHLLELYIDGVVVASLLDNTLESVSSSNTMTLTNYNSTFNCGLDDLRIYGKALSNYEIADLFNTYTIPDISQESDLDTLSVVDYDFVEGSFAPGTNDYSCILAYGTTQASIQATALNYWARIQGTGYFSSLPGKAPLLVTAEDRETTSSYSIAFTLAESSLKPITDDLADFVMTPNPATEFCYINTKSENLGKEIYVYDCLGKQKMHFTLTRTNQELNLKNFNRGLYFIQMGDSYEKLIVK